MFKVFTALCLASAIWLPSLQFFYPVETSQYRQSDGVAPLARQLAERHLAIWRDPALRQTELSQMQKRNPEWDFMSRTYFVLALANMALHDDTMTDESIEIMDAIIENTLLLEEEKGQTHFLLGYALQSKWVMTPSRSQFIDGEIAMMMAARRLVKETPRYTARIQARAAIMMKRMKQSAVLSAESYPDECWLFCNTVSLAAIAMMDALDGSDHSAFLQEWVGVAKAKLSHGDTGMLISSYGVDGTPAPSGHCPEGSTLFMSAHMLDLVDSAFAADQYQKAKQALSGSFFGFGYAKEWPKSCKGSPDIDSGPIVPLLNASAAASGMAVLGAAVFDDDSYLDSLLRSLNLMAFPTESAGALRYQASNPVGDAVLLYAMVEGPLWAKVKGAIP